MLPVMPALALHAMPHATEREAVFLLRLWRICLQYMMVSTTGSSVATELLLLIRKLMKFPVQEETSLATPFVQVLDHLCDAAVKLLTSELPTWFAV